MKLNKQWMLKAGLFILLGSPALRAEYPIQMPVQQPVVRVGVSITPVYVPPPVAYVPPPAYNSCSYGGCSTPVSSCSHGGCGIPPVYYPVPPPPRPYYPYYPPYYPPYYHQACHHKHKSPWGFAFNYKALGFSFFTGG